LTYAQAAELTWPQLMHALGIEADAIRDSEVEMAAKQDEIFGRIVQGRRCLPVDLLRVPAGDLLALVADETGETLAAPVSLLSGLKRFVSNGD